MPSQSQLYTLRFWPTLTCGQDDERVIFPPRLTRHETRAPW